MQGNKKNVFETYNKIADWYSENHYKGLIQRVYVDEVIELAGTNAKILDLGCGTGVPIMEYLISNGLSTLGVDGSAAMLEIARKNLPEAAFLQHDMRTLSLDDKFDAIIAWNSFFHLPSDDQLNMFTVFKNHLNINGVLLFTSGTEHGEAWGINGGENLYHASLSSEEYHGQLDKHGFMVIRHVENDSACGGATVWMAQLIK